MKKRSWSVQTGSDKFPSGLCFHILRFEPATISKWITDLLTTSRWLYVFTLWTVRAVRAFRNGEMLMFPTQTVEKPCGAVGAPCCCLFHCPTVLVSQRPGHDDGLTHMQLYTQHVNAFIQFDLIPSTLKPYIAVTPVYCIDISFLHWFNHFNGGFID